MQTQAGTDLIMTWIMKPSIAAENGASSTSLSVPRLILFFSIIPHSSEGSVKSPLLNRSIHDSVQTGITQPIGQMHLRRACQGPHASLQAVKRCGGSRNFGLSFYKATV